MKGIEEYNNKYRTMAMNRIAKNEDLDFLDGFYAFIDEMSKSTSYNYLTFVIRFCRFNEITNPEDIRLAHYNKFLASLGDKEKSYRMSVYAGLLVFSQFLKANYGLQDYMENVRPPKQKRVQALKPKECLTADEVKGMKANMESKPDCWRARDIAILMTLFGTGIRRAALYKLDTSDVNLIDGTIKVAEKGGIERNIIMPDCTIEALKTWMRYRKEILGDTKEDAMFISNRKVRMSIPSIYIVIKEAGCDIEGKHVSPHKLRATYATLLYKESKDIYFVQKCMGHCSPQTTEIYVRGQDAEAAKRSAGLIGKFM